MRCCGHHTGFTRFDCMNMYMVSIYTLTRLDALAEMWGASLPRTSSVRSSGAYIRPKECSACTTFHLACASTIPSASPSSAKRSGIPLVRRALGHITGPLRAIRTRELYNHSVPKRLGADEVGNQVCARHQRQRGHAPPKRVGVLRIVMSFAIEAAPWALSAGI